jgi:chemotaxis protein MotB
MGKIPHTSGKNNDDDDSDAWLLTYGDLMTQLLCFFVLLMSFSVVSSMKFREVIVSLQEALRGQGVLVSRQAVIDDIPRSRDVVEGLETSRAEDRKLLELRSAFDKHIKEHNMSDHVGTEIRKEGLAIILKQREPPVFFDTADARIREEAYPILNQIAQMIAGLSNDIRVEGHTDSRPIGTPQFPSNWELSTMRATNVLRYLHAMTGTAPERLSAAGYGPYRPIASNDTELGMSKNRRVEIVILRMEIRDR